MGLRLAPKYACPASRPYMLKHRVQQEYNSLLVDALNHIFKCNLSLNNFKWLLKNWSFHAFEILLYAILENAS